MWKEEKGITLVALALIIVVLLIIAGVSISVALQNSGSISLPNQSAGGNSDTAPISYEDAEDKVRLIFELCESYYQIDLAKGDATDRSQVFTHQTILGMLDNYNIEGNTESTLGEIDLTNGVTINYGDYYTFLVRVSNGGMVTVIEK